MVLDAGGLCLRAAIGVMFLTFAAGRADAQTSPPAARDSLTSELAARVASAIAPQVRVTLEPGADAIVDAAMVEQFAARGVQVVSAAGGVPSLRVSCFDNLRESACAAELAGAARSTILVTRRHELMAPQAADRLEVKLQSLVSHNTPILDIARSGDDLLVLTRGAIARYRHRDEGWTRVEARAISSARPWPRDIRGRLRIADSTLEAFLPGVTCSGAIDPLSIVCANDERSWPLDIEGARLEAGRNHFTVPGGLTFYGIAGLDEETPPTRNAADEERRQGVPGDRAFRETGRSGRPGADAGARWLAASLDRRLTFIDDTRQAIPTAVVADDVAALRRQCASGPLVLASTSDRDDETVRLFRVVRRQLTPAANAVALPGEVTALWPSASGDAATVITRDRDAGRYVAHELTVSCSR